LGLAVVRHLSEVRSLATAPELEAFETDMLAEFVLARASAGIADSTIQKDADNLGQLREWFGRPLWEMEPPDADRYFGEVLRDRRPATRSNRANTLRVYFEFLELRHKVSLHAMTGRVIECPLDEINRPRSSVDTMIRIPPTEDEVGKLFTGWRAELADCRKFATAARNYTAARLIADVGLRINEVRMLDLADVRWELGRFGKLNVRFGKGSRRRGAKQRLVPLINGADVLLRWFIQDVWGQFDHDHTRVGAPLFPSERKNCDGTASRVGADVLRVGLAASTARHLPDWRERLSPHVLRHFCASQLYLSGMDLVAIQELLGHAWILTTMRYVNPQELRLMGLIPRSPERGVMMAQRIPVAA